MPYPPRDSPRRRPTIADVARRAGVSSAAVSFAVNDRPGVSPGTRERILAAARELGWRPSASARALTEARTRAVGLVVERDPGQLEVDASFARFLFGVERTLRSADYALLLLFVPAGDGSAFERLVAAERVDGFLVRDVRAQDPWFEPLLAAGVPVVLAGAPDGDCPFPWVQSRDAEGVAASVVGFDDSPLAAIASLTSVRVDYAELGSAAAAALPAQIEGKPAPPCAASAPRLVVRASTARAR